MKKILYFLEFLVFIISLGCLLLNKYIPAIQPYSIYFILILAGSVLLILITMGISFYSREIGSDVKHKKKPVKNVSRKKVIFDNVTKTELGIPLQPEKVLEDNSHPDKIVEENGVADSVIPVEQPTVVDEVVAEEKTPVNDDEVPTEEVEPEIAVEEVPVEEVPVEEEKSEASEEIPDEETPVEEQVQEEPVAEEQEEVVEEPLNEEVPVEEVAESETVEETPVEEPVQVESEPVVEEQLDVTEEVPEEEVPAEQVSEESEVVEETPVEEPVEEEKEEVAEEVPTEDVQVEEQVQEEPVVEEKPEEPKEENETTIIPVVAPIILDKNEESEEVMPEEPVEEETSKGPRLTLKPTVLSPFRIFNDYTYSIGRHWSELFQGEVDKTYFKDMVNFLQDAYDTKNVYPPKEDLMKCFEYCDFDNTRVVIIGKFPFYRKNQADGLAFSTRAGKSPNQTTSIIIKEAISDVGIPVVNSGSLVNWARNGVLLLNSIMTAPSDKPASHSDCGWVTFTNKIIELLNMDSTPKAFVLWGEYAQGLKSLITNPNHLILEAPNPSPLSAANGFYGSKPFSKINEFLEKNNIDPIDWSL